MKKASIRRFSVLFVIAFFFLTPTADLMAQYKPFYVGAFGGYIVPQDMNFDYGGMFPPSIGTVDLDNSWMLGVKIGWIPFGAQCLALELEYSHYFDQDFSGQYLVGIIREDGIVKLDNFLINALLRYPQGNFHPYIGIGLGISFFNMAGTESAPLIGRNGSYSEDDSAFAWQILAGVTFDIKKNWAAELSYRAFFTDPRFVSAEAEYMTHVFAIGINWFF